MESHFDEHHNILDRGSIISRSKLEELDKNNPHTIPILRVLGSNQDLVRKHLNERKIKFREVNPTG